MLNRARSDRRPVRDRAALAAARHRRPAEAFRLANQHRGRRGLPPRFRLRFAAPIDDAGHVGRAVDRRPGAAAAGVRRPTWVVVVGQPTEHLGDVTPAVATTARWLKRRLGDRCASLPASIAW
jgi:hypothetical protein